MPTQPEPPAPQPQPGAEDEELPRPTSDPAALEILEAAARRQNADTLAHEGVTAFRVVFGRARFEHDGSLVTADPRGLSVVWAAPDRIRTRMVIDGNPTERGVRRTGFGTEAPWAFDGRQVTALTRAEHPQDLDQIDRDRRMVRALLDVAFLRRMLEDQSVWKREPSMDVRRDTASLVAIRRIPPAPAREEDDGEAARMEMLLLVDPATHDVRALFLPPRTRDDPAFEYHFEYHEKFPDVTGAGEGGVRFPFQVTVRRRDGPTVEPQLVMEVHTETVAFNAAAEVTDATFAPPK